MLTPILGVKIMGEIIKLEAHMKKIYSVFIVFAAVCLLSVPSFAIGLGNLTISANAGLYTPSNGQSSIMYGVAADYGITENWSLRGAVQTTTYDQSGVQTTYTPVTVDLIYSQQILNLKPYLGAGVSYNMTSSGGVSTQTTGVQAEAGISWALGGFNAGFEFRYLIPDVNHMDTGAMTYSGSANGSITRII